MHGSYKYKIKKHREKHWYSCHSPKKSHTGQDCMRMHKIICIQICRGAARISNYMLKWWRAQLIIYLFWNKTYTAIVPHRRSPSVARSRLSTLVIHSGPPNVNSISFSFSWGDYNEWWEIVLLLREALHDERWEYIQHISNRSGDFCFSSMNQHWVTWNHIHHDQALPWF